MMKAALMNKKVERGKDVDDAEALAVLKTLAKQRHESVEAFRKGSREEMAQKRPRSRLWKPICQPARR